MEKELYTRVIEILTRLEAKIDAIDERTERIERQINDDTPEYSQMYNGGVVNG